MSDRTFFIGFTVFLACLIPFGVAAVTVCAKDRDWFAVGLAALATCWIIFGVIALVMSF